MSLLATYFLFFIYPLTARVLIFLKKREAMGVWSLGWVIGILQDLAVVSLMLALFKAGAAPLLIAALLVYHLFDALLVWAADFRMKFSFFRYLLEFKDFQSSAIAMGIRPLALLLAIAYFAIYACFWLLPIVPAFSPLLLVLGVSGGLVSLFFQGKMYFYANPFFQEAVSVLAGLFKESKKEKIALISPQCEIAKPLFARYPLLKMTEGFYGEKAFEVRVDQGERPHILLIALESLGAKYLGFAKRYEGATPCLDQMGKEGVIFTNFHTAGIPTARSLQSTLFGIYPDLDPISLQERNPLYPLIGIQNLLKQRGYRTLYHKGGSLFFLNAVKYLSHHGFDELAGDEEIMAALKKDSRTSWGVHDTQLFAYSFRRLKQLDQEKTPAFMMLCTISNHHPWQVPERFQAPSFNVESSLLSRYLQTVYYTDFAIGGFIDQLKKSGLARRTIVLITADNAQPMGEHEGNYMPLKEGYQENQWIPLIIGAEGRIPEPKSIDTLASQVDLFPTIMDMLSLKGVNHSVGTTLMRNAPERHIFCVNTHILPYVSHSQEDYKLIVRLDVDKKQLFDLKKDPDETIDLSEKCPEVTHRLYIQLLDQFTSLQRLYSENRITPETDKSIVLLGDKETSDKTLLEEARKQDAINSILISECDQITDAGFVQMLSHVEKLQFLYLNKIRLTRVSIQALKGKCADLKELTLSFTHSVSAQAIISLVNECSKLEELTLSGNIQVQDDVIEAIAVSCPRLQNLELSECHGLTSKGIAAIATGCPALNRLNLQGLSCVDDAALARLAQGPYTLQTLHILDCSNVTGQGLWMVCQKHRKLRRLSFTAENVDTDTIVKISATCKDLMKLVIHGCQHFTTEGYLAIAKNLPKIVILELADCPSLTDEFFDHIADKPLDHLLIAGAPKITNHALAHIQKLLTLRALIFYACPKLSPEHLLETATKMNKTGILHEVTLNRLKKVFYRITH